MKIKTTYIGKTASGVSAIWCGFKPKDADITREYKILNPDDGKILKHKESGREYKKVILSNEDEMNDYEEIDGEMNNDLTI